MPKRKRAVHGPKEKAAWTRSGAVALRADGGRRIGASADFGPPSGTLGPSAIFLTAVPWREYQPCRGGYRMELLLFSLPLAAPRGNWRSGPIKASAPTTARAARSEAERAEREADQMRPCTPLTFTPAPRESAFKPVPHPAAPVGRSSQTRRHHLSSTPVQQLCTDVQSCDQKRFFSYTGRGAFSFWR